MELFVDGVECVDDIFAMAGVLPGSVGEVRVEVHVHVRVVHSIGSLRAHACSDGGTECFDAAPLHREAAPVAKVLGLNFEGKRGSEALGVVALSFRAPRTCSERVVAQSSAVVLAENFDVGKVVGELLEGRQVVVPMEHTDRTR